MNLNLSIRERHNGNGITIPSIRWDAPHFAMEAAEENDKSVSTDLKETVQESFNNYQVAGLKRSSYLILSVKYVRFVKYVGIHMLYKNIKDMVMKSSCFIIIVFGTGLALIFLQTHGATGCFKPRG
jgi:hypothetical protein